MADSDQRRAGMIPARRPTPGTRYLEDPGGPVLNLDLIAREIALDYLDERGLDPTDPEAADLLHLPPGTVGEILTGERRIGAEELSYLVAALAGGDPVRFFRRHELTRGDPADALGRDETKLADLLAAFTPDELVQLLGRAADIKRVGPGAWARFSEVLEALYRTATARISGR